MVEHRWSRVWLGGSLAALSFLATGASCASGQFAGNENSGVGRAGARSFSSSANSAIGSATGSGSSTNQGAPNQRAIQIVLREGTSIGPIRGRFVVRGQRWSFLADAVTKSSEEGKSQWVDDGLTRETLPNQDTVLGRQRNPAGDQDAVTADTAVLDSPLASDPRSSAPTPTFELMLVIENLMLDRIARAIEEDPQDDYWVITATVTEFQDENRLMVLTANRARRSPDL